MIKRLTVLRAAAVVALLTLTVAAPAQGPSTKPAQAHGHAADDTADMQVLETLRRAGADLGKPHTPVYFANFPSQSALNAARKDVDAAGFKVVRAGRSDDGKAWILITTRAMPLTVDNVRNASRAMKAAANQHGGRYDGWEAEPRK
jgi:hypothetical protein